LSKIIDLLRSVLKPESKGKTAIAVVVVFVVFAIALQRAKITELQNKIGMLSPDTTVLKIEKVVHDTVVKHVADTVWRRVAVVTKDSSGAAVQYENWKLIYDTVRVSESGRMMFEDESNRLVKVKGWIDYPSGDARLIYTEKRFWDLTKRWGVFGEIGVFDSDLMVGVSGYYRKVSIGIGAAGRLSRWNVRVGYKLL